MFIQSENDPFHCHSAKQWNLDTVSFFPLAAAYFHFSTLVTSASQNDSVTVGGKRPWFDFKYTLLEKVLSHLELMTPAHILHTVIHTAVPLKLNFM